MPPKIDITGQRFGKLLVVGEAGKGWNRPLWECVCDCGEKVFALAGNLRSGAPRQCRKCVVEMNTKHGCSNTTKQNPTREYQSWNSARGRCFNTKDKSYSRYGGRGISFSAEWADFRRFLADLGPCPPGYELERIDVNGDYCKENCKWVSSKEQANNRRVTIKVSYLGEEYPLAILAEKLGFGYRYFAQAIATGYTPEEIVDRRNKGLAHKKIKFGRGENCSCAKLKDSQVVEIRREYARLPISGTRKKPGVVSALAGKYGITKGHLHKLVLDEYR